MHQRLLLLLSSITAVSATSLTVQDPITGCVGNAYCTGFQECGNGNFCHRRNSCGNWGGKANTCCYADNSDTCIDVAGQEFLNDFTFSSSGTAAVLAKPCPSGTLGVAYAGKEDMWVCCPKDSTDVILELEGYNATLLEPSVPLSEKNTRTLQGRCFGAGFKDDGSEDEPSETTAGATNVAKETGTPTGTSTGTSTPNAAYSNSVSGMIGLSFFALVLGFV
ncbi:hypothetical protein TWF281_002415 [Arthrobotrys megalospora]